MRFTLAVVLGAAVLAAAAEVEPRTEGFRNATVVAHLGGSDPAAALTRLVRAQQGPAWIAYEVPAAAENNMCCFSTVHQAERGDGGGCRLEGDGTFESGMRAPVVARGMAAVRVLLRAEQGRVTRVRAFSSSCPLDAASRTVHHVTGVSGAQSAAFLSTLVPGGVRGEEDGVMMALSAHEALPAARVLIDRARTLPSSHGRGQALFWLSQRAGAEAREAIAQAVEKDPDSEVREKAVFALSQLPADEGLPLLMRHARGHRDPEVRKKAMFWIGQSGDARAVAFFEEVLTARK